MLRGRQRDSKGSKNGSQDKTKADDVRTTNGRQLFGNVRKQVAAPQSKWRLIQLPPSHYTLESDQISASLSEAASSLPWIAKSKRKKRKRKEVKSVQSECWGCSGQLKPQSGFRCVCWRDGRAKTVIVGPCTGHLF
jgi:hypothetical protein